MTEEMFTATHEGELFGLPPTGRRLAVKGMQKFLIADGVVQENHAYYNEQEIRNSSGSRSRRSWGNSRGSPGGSSGDAVVGRIGQSVGPETRPAIVPVLRPVTDG